MLIGIDASRVGKLYKTGTETYTIELIKALSLIDKKNEYILYTPLRIEEKLPNLGKNFRFKILPFGRFWTQIRLSYEMLSNKPDILFIPAHTLPLFFPKKSVVTIHDLGFKHFPELYSKNELLYQNWALRHSIKRAKHLITPSDFTKIDIIEHLDISASKISVIYEGYDANTFHPISPLKKKTPPYLLFIGRLEEKKNVLGMIRSYGILRKEKNIKHKFILAGRPGFGYEKILAEIEKLPDAIRRDIELPGYVSQEKYVELLKNADILFFCTFFEGFGLPPLEAMASGVPVVASNRTSIPEIAGTAAMLVNPDKPFEMAAALSKVINNEGLRKVLISKGFARATLFSWKKCAEETLELLERVYNINK